MQPSDIPLYLALADALRDRIQRGDYPAGQALPIESAICHEHGVSRMTVRRALAVLREEGLVTTRRGAPSTVRPVSVRQTLVLRHDDRLISRMPSRHERMKLGLDVGVPVLEVDRSNGTSELHAADQVTVACHALSPSPPPH
ncbi:GntR family transcriptional regulator [Dactylosporangium cerinum]|uniref:GntR family transcriptional regulator n=1 Tax=Dactylosporangium cerinum TaxID=1434730 RepID=A0ABV9WI18_9ACTN